VAAGYTRVEAESVEADKRESIGDRLGLRRSKILIGP